MTKVVFPCDQGTWWQVKHGLHQLKQICLEEDVDFQRVAVEHQYIINISIGIGDYGIAEYKQTTFYNLAQFFIKNTLSTEREHFLKVTLPGIIDLALKVECLLPTEGIAVSEQQNGETRLLERQLCCSILACAFLCLIPDTYRHKLGRTINFTKFFSFLYLSSQMAKLRCILNFFDRVSQEYDRLEGNIQFTRLVIKRDELPTLDTWLNSAAELCPIHVKQDGCIEDSCPEAIEVDFANKYIGGGTVGKGRVQEEIRFTVCPELIVSMLFMEYMEDNEAIFIKGYEQFSRTDGYSGGLTYIGDCIDTCQRDVDGLLKNTLCAIDAISYSHKEGTSLARQYQDYYVLRDLNKAFVGFSTPFIIPEELPERGSNDDDYFTADEDTSRTNEHMSAIDMFVDDLLRQAMILALPEALMNKHENLCAISKSEHSDKPNSHLLTNDEVHMNHLEVNFRDWYANYRRRSSNLSDLSSRRSSWDVASRRSSGCSMRGYSSEFSSEFEEYYDNFQSQDQKYSFHTIKEESGPSSINEFASSLASSLLTQCTIEVSQLESGIQRFDDARPSDVKNPQPYRLNPIIESCVVSSEIENLCENSVRLYVDDLFKDIWPFGLSVNRNNHSREKILASMNLVKTSNDVDINEVNKGNKTDAQDKIDDDYLLEVADKIVCRAFEEALVEYKYRYVSPAMRNVETQVSSDSSQSDHSSGPKDQSVSSNVAQISSNSQSNLMSHTSSTVISQSEVPLQSTSAIAVAERVMLRLFDTTDNRSVNNNQSCDISHTEASQSLLHSSLNSSSPYIHVDSREVNKHLYDGASPSSSQNVNLDISINNSASQDLQSAPQSVSHCLTDHYQFCDMLGNHPSYVHSSLTSDSSSSQRGTSLHSKSSNSNSYGSSRGSSGKSSKNSTGKYPQTGSRRKASTKLSLDRSAINSSESSNTPSSDSEKLSSASQSGFLDDRVEKRLRKPEKSPEGARHKSRINFHDPLHHGSQRHHHHHHHVVGSKKNYDQFANCLSRDLLTNAFIQVQEHKEPFIYPRRSSEPLQISDGAALQRLENSIHYYNGKRSQKSMTVEDIGQFEEAWSYEIECYQKTRTGFRDPILSRFAEELMKVNVSIPTLQLLSDCVSTSGSSRSVCSTISSFRDPLLASFEDELLNTSLNRSQGSFKTQISWSKMKGGMCSPRENESKPKTGKPRMNSISIDSEISGISYKSAKSNHVLVCPEEVAEFAECLARRILCEALTASAIRNGEDGTDFNIELYSDLLAADIISAAVLDVEKKCSDWLEQNKVVTWSDETDTHEYSGDGTQQVLKEVVIDDQRSSINSLETGSSCVEYEDALSFPYTRLEEFADDMATRVLHNSVAITKREQTAAARRLYGRPISTGNWGCGAFGGDPHLKSLLQWLAASYAGTPSLIYYTFNHQQMGKFQEVIDTIQTRGWDVSQLMQAIRRYCITAESELRLTGVVSKDLFTVILQGEVFPGT